MPETHVVEIITYDIDELKDNEQGDGYADALDFIRRGQFDDRWWDSTYDWIDDLFEKRWGVRMLDPEKFTTFDTDRSHFAFKAYILDERTFLRAAGIDLRTKVARRIIEDEQLMIGLQFGYGAEYSFVGYAGYEALPDYVEDEGPGTRDKLQAALGEMKGVALKALRDEIDYLESEETLAEIARMNDYRFTARGAIWIGDWENG